MALICRCCVSCVEDGSCLLIFGSERELGVDVHWINLSALHALSSTVVSVECSYVSDRLSFFIF